MQTLTEPALRSERRDLAGCVASGNSGASSGSRYYVCGISRVRVTQGPTVVIADSPATGRSDVLSAVSQPKPRDTLRRIYNLALIFGRV